ncbi:MAG TPA: hypothetical protein VE861_01155 [Gemmatimonadaceae bacterium]|nr:hypothetical protein [Gemmatimonadaceae bacterium]
MAQSGDGSRSGKGHAKEKNGMSGEALKQGQMAGGAEKTQGGSGKNRKYGSTGSKSSGGTGSSQGSGGGSGGTRG